MGRADKNLRHGKSPLRALDHLAASLWIAAHVELCERNPLAVQKRLRRMAIGTIACDVNFDFDHATRAVDLAFYMGGRAAATTRAKTSTSTLVAPARNSARAPASTVAPEVSTSSTSTTFCPARAPLGSGGTRNAPCTFKARSDCDKPTCCGVALTRFNAPWTTGMPVTREMTSASSADWLNRRAHCRRQCNGTGTMASAAPVTSWPAFAIQHPMVGARSSRSPYLSACTSARATSS